MEIELNVYVYYCRYSTVGILELEGGWLAVVVLLSMQHAQAQAHKTTRRKSGS